MCKFFAAFSGYFCIKSFNSYKNSEHIIIFSINFVIIIIDLQNYAAKVTFFLMLRWSD
jgi:hypothetical protein